MQEIETELSSLDLGLARLNKLAPKGYALALHIRFASANLMFQTYEPKWVERYTERGYMLYDPLVSWGFSREGAVRWSALPMPDPHGILIEAAEHDLRFGVAVSCGPISSRSIGGFARSDREFTDTEISMIESTVRLIHEAATPTDKLTPAQRHALRSIATGYRHAEAAALLGISESALKARLKAARERLFARTTAEAIQRAREYNLL
jgi:LuxR family transcriptional regulator, quorum-sensing system regulator SdiA